MSEARDPATLALIQAARTEYARGLAAKAADLQALVARGAWGDARRAAHRLRGSAGVYGFGALGVIAAALDELLLRADGAPDASASTHIHETLREIREEAERASREHA
jgi:HPt (histidine-containing phosphotransfer) domain-containing protein